MIEQVRETTIRLSWGIQSVYSNAERWLVTRNILSTKKLSLPDFLGIGAQKVGTTWLYDNLRCHPELFLPDIKELHYFDCRLHKSLKSYSRYFLLGKNKIKGEISPSYSILPIERVRLIRSLLPNVKLIFLLRNPVERAWSHAIMNLVSRHGKNFEEVSEREFLSHFQARRSLDRGDFRTILAKWLSMFPRRQLYVGFFEDIQNRPRELLRSLFKFLEVDSNLDLEKFPFREKINPSPEIPTPEHHKEFLTNLYREEILFEEVWKDNNRII